MAPVMGDTLFWYGITPPGVYILLAVRINGPYVVG
jgi:hypothetical protein